MSLLPAISPGTLIVFGPIWEALHDIARGELDARLEWALLALMAPAFILLCRPAAGSPLWVNGSPIPVY